MSAIILSEKEALDPLPYAKDVNDRNDRKYSYISVLLAHLANTKKFEFKSPFGNSSFIADHIEWAQFHSYLELRRELKSKVSQFIKSIKVDTDVAEAYAAIKSVIVRFAYDYTLFNNVVNDDIYKKWALSCVHSGQREWLVDDINQNIDSPQFLPDHDYLFYAYDSEDCNEFKYARVKNLLEKKIYKVNSSSSTTLSSVTADKDTAEEKEKYKQEDEQGELTLKTKEKAIAKTVWSSDDFKNDLHDSERQSCGSYVSWAKFRHVNELRKDLINEFNKIVCTSDSSACIANAFAEVVKVISDLSYKRIDDKTYTDLYQWVLSVNCSQQDKSIITRELSKYIQNDGFLVSLPTNNIVPF
jgi:hypothetical protein